MDGCLVFGLLKERLKQMTRDRLPCLAGCFAAIAAAFSFLLRPIFFFRLINWSVLCRNSSRNGRSCRRARLQLWHRFVLRLFRNLFYLLKCFRHLILFPLPESLTSISATSQFAANTAVVYIPGRIPRTVNARPSLRSRIAPGDRNEFLFFYSRTKIIFLRF